MPTFCTIFEQIEDAMIRVHLCMDEGTSNENIAILASLWRFLLNRVAKQ